MLQTVPAEIGCKEKRKEVVLDYNRTRYKNAYF